MGHSLLIFVGLLVLLVLSAGAFLWWAQQGHISPGIYEGPIFTYTTQVEKGPAETTLNILTWNIAYAQGRGSGGDVRVPKRSKAEMIQALKKMAQVIREEKAHIVLLQEIDFGSSRSYFIDQLQFLAQETQMPYGAQALSWRVNYLPYPYFPPQKHFGKILSGGAVLSRFPILENSVKIHPGPGHHPRWYRPFFIGRYSQKVVIEMNGKARALFNNHLEAFHQETRQNQAYSLTEWVKETAQKTSVLVVGGDLNTVPPEAQKTSQFPDGPDDYTGDQTLIHLRQNLPGLSQAIAFGRYQDTVKDFTFPAWAPTRVLDYLFAPSKLTIDAHIPEVGDLSDHLPLKLRLHLP